LLHAYNRWVSLKLYNTASGELEELALGKTVSLYTCGITPYDSAHMGHIFTFVTYDILQRYLEFLGHEVKLVRNITDVDEPIYERAATMGIPYTQLAAEETAKFQQVLSRLNFRPAFVEPRASQYVEQMASAVKQLLGDGHAYELDGDIYFDVATFKDFGSVSNFSTRLKLAFMRDRGGDPNRPGKRNMLDFLLWKRITDKADPAAWDSAVGYGRPGWHIECSVMASELLDLPLDIHGGGMDLIFPHHECENAQSISLTGEPFAKHWMHVAPLGYHGEKMSKSLGNLVFAKDLLKTYDPAVLRLGILQYHYRAGGEWHNDALKNAEEVLDKIRGALSKSAGANPGPFWARFTCALSHDLDAPELFHVMEDFSDAIQAGGTSEDSTDVLRRMLDICGVPVT
jgi:L-cysteine:1D-myo-inositol 2-amino-2-deoxy-alpha-D-glucopyranoside ligase